MFVYVGYGPLLIARPEPPDDSGPSEFALMADANNALDVDEDETELVTQNGQNS